MPASSSRAQAKERYEGKKFASVWLGTAIAVIAVVIVTFYFMMFGGS